MSWLETRHSHKVETQRKTIEAMRGRIKELKTKNKMLLQSERNAQVRCEDAMRRLRIIRRFVNTLEETDKIIYNLKGK